MQLTRDSAVVTISFVSAVLTFLGTQFGLLHDAFPMMTSVVDARIKFAAAIVGFIAGWMKMSPLPLSEDHPLASGNADVALSPINSSKVVGLLLACALGASVMTAPSCASVPIKQKALVSIQSVETALGSAQDFERANYVALGENVPASDRLRAFCPPSALPAPLPANATVHQVVSCLFAQAFTSQKASSDALIAWSPGSAPPTVMGQLRGEVDTIFAIVKGFSANANQQQLLSLAQSTVDSVLVVVQQLGGNVPSIAPGGGQ